MSGPRTVIGAPVFNKAEYLPSALESLLGQTDPDLAILVLDDRSDDDTVEVARSYAARDPRVVVEVNERRIGMLENTRRAFTRARELFPEARYWALGSDHDLWHPRWHETLRALLDADPRVVLAYPQADRIDEHGVPYARRKPLGGFDSRDIADPRRRMRASFRGMVAGDMIYGLFRADALETVGTYRGVLVPDRLLLCELALRGPFAQAREVLWSRRFRGLAELDRQARAFWPGGDVPAYTRLPWWQVHAALLAWDYGVLGKGADVGLDRRAGMRIAADYLGVSIRHRIWRRARRIKHRAIEARNVAARALLVDALERPRVRRWVRRRVVPALQDAEATLDRVTASDGRPPDRVPAGAARERD